jgi:hypothetical protein
MPVTATPIFAQRPNVGNTNIRLHTAMVNTEAFDGTGTVTTSINSIFTAGPNGSRVDQITCRLSSRNALTASGTSAATAVRFWINNGNVNTDANNNIYFGEVAIPATSVASLSSTAFITYPLLLPNGGLNLPANNRIFAGTTVAAGGTNIAIAVDAIGGDY